MGSSPAAVRIWRRSWILRCSHSARDLYTGIVKCVSVLGKSVSRESCAGTCATSIGRSKRPASMPHTLSQQILKLNFCPGLFVSVFHNHGRVDGDAPVLTGTAGDGAGTGNKYSALRDDERLVVRSAVDFAADQIVDRRGAIQDCAGSEYRFAFDDCALVHATVAANQDVVFDDDR